MKKPLLSIIFCLFLTCSSPIPALADFTQVSIALSDRKLALSLIQQTATSYFQIQSGDLQPYLKEEPFQVIPLFYLSTVTKTTPAAVWKQKGKGWGKLGKELGLPANFHGKYISAKNKHKKGPPPAKENDLLEELFIIRFLHECYGADPELLFYWRARGLTYDDLFIGVNLGLRLKKSPAEFFALRISGKDWQFIAAKFKVSYLSLGQPAKEKDKPKPKPKPSPPANKGKGGKGKK